MPTEKPKLVVSTGPFKNVIFLGHTSVAERDAEAGREGSTLEDADFSDLYRSTLPEAHDKFAPVLQSMSGVVRGVNKEQTAKNQARAKEGKTVKDVPESFVDYADRVKAQATEDDWKAIDAKFREIALATPVDASPSKRTGAASKANLEKADEILNRTADAIESTISKMLGLVPDYDLVRDDEGKPERTSLARMIGAYISAQTGGL